MTKSCGGLDDQDDRYSSMEMIHRKHLYPLSQPCLDFEEFIPSDLCLLPGEAVSHANRTTKGAVLLSNYRLFLAEKGRVVVRIPIYAINRSELVDLVRMKVITKTGRSILVTFPDSQLCTQWLGILTVDPPLRLDKLFAFYFRAYLETLPYTQRDETNECHNEFERLRFNQDVWKITDINKDYSVCSTYPQFHIIPRDTPDNSIKKIAGFRSLGRFPSVVWRSGVTGAVLIRCAQPCVGIMLWRNLEDEHFVTEVVKSCHRDPGTAAKKSTSPPRLLIMDARNYGAAQLNRIKGGGFEYAEYYDKTDITFMSIPNIHNMRDSFDKLTQLHSGKSDLSWFAGLEKSNWLHNISQLIKSSMEIVVALHIHARPVMVHCSDGWDRTPQLTSLAQVLLDPYYRTFKGFQVLIKREWLDFGHKFGDRCGHGVGSIGLYERSPIFMQWLDCIHQLLEQFPKAFQFNDTYLIKLGIHVYSTMFGTFLCNSAKERVAEGLPSKTCDVFAYLLQSSTSWKMKNFLYEEKYKEVLSPSWQLRDIKLWNALYVSTFAPSGDADDLGSLLDIDLVSETPADSLESTQAGPPSVEDDPLGHTPLLRRHHSTSDLLSSVEQDSFKVTSNGTGSYREGSAPSKLCSSEATNGFLSHPTSVHSSLNCPSTDTVPNDLSQNDALIDSTCQPITLTGPLRSMSLDLMCATPSLNNNAVCDPMSLVSSDITSDQLSSSPPEGVTGGLGSSTDTLTEIHMTSSISTAISSSVAAAVYKPELSNRIINAAPTSGFNSEDFVENNKVEDNHQKTTYLQCDALSIEQDTGNSSETDEGPHSSKLPSELPRSLGYGTGSDLSSSPPSSGPPTPDNYEDRQPHWSTPVATLHPQSSLPIPLASHISVESGVPGTCVEAESEDSDGLVLATDPVTLHLYTMYKNNQASRAAHFRELRSLRRQYDQLLKTKAAIDATKKEIEQESLRDRSSSIDSEAGSFDIVDPAETKFTTWVPDELAVTCHKCATFFSLINRKHHCRSCGNVFCASCSSNSCPVPREQIFTPVRVCSTCYVSLLVPKSPPPLANY